MNFRELGNTGVLVSEIGFGCGGNAGLMVRGTPQQQREVIQRGLELGINYFDQAPDYGDGLSETNLGRVLKELGARPYITTKVEVRAEDLGDIADHIVDSMDQSLDRLGMDQVDFLQLHNGPVLERPELSGRGYAHLSRTTCGPEGRWRGSSESSAAARPGSSASSPGATTTLPRSV